MNTVERSLEGAAPSAPGRNGCDEAQPSIGWISPVRFLPDRGKRVLRWRCMETAGH